jgi:prevent-host-death family protein
MIQVSLVDVKARLSEYLDRALAGERIVICRHNTPVVELRPVDAVRMEPRPVGPLAGRQPFDVPPSFFEPLPDDELEAWEGLAGTSPAMRSSGGVARVAERKADDGRASTRRTRRPRR